MTTSPLRIALAAHRYASLEQSGIPRYVAELCAAIGRRPDRDRYVLVTPPEAGDASGCGVPVERLRGGRRAVQLCWHLAGHPRLERLTRRPALVHALYPFAPIPTRAPLVTTFHDLLPLTRPEWFGRVNAAKFRRASRHLAAASAHVIADSEVVATQLTQQLDIERDRITVVPLGVSSAFREPPQPATARRVCAQYGVEPGSFFVAVGYVSQRKNLLTVLRALDAAGAGVRLPVVLAGPAGRGSEAVATATAQLHLTDRIIVTGPLPEFDLATLVASAAALLHPATHEGFGLPPLEAMAAGTPVIASRGGAVQEVAGDAAVLLEPDDVEGWAGAFRDVAGDAGHRERLRAAGLERARPYTWERTAELTVDVHQRVLESGAST